MFHNRKNILGKININKLMYFTEKRLRGTPVKGDTVIVENSIF
jgi:hypothetical protein